MAKKKYTQRRRYKKWLSQQPVSIRCGAWPVKETPNWANIEKRVEAQLWAEGALDENGEERKAEK